jgi:hypothetical protein
MSPRKFKDYDDDTIDSWWGNQSFVGLFFKGLGLVIVLSLVFGVVGFFGGWFNAGKDIISPANVKAQWQFAYDFDRSLDAISKQYCTAVLVENAETDPTIKPQRTDQRIAIENNYQRVEAEYDGRLADAFRAKLVKPSNVPSVAPTLGENVASNCTGSIVVPK